MISQSERTSERCELFNNSFSTDECSQPQLSGLTIVSVGLTPGLERVDTRPSDHTNTEAYIEVQSIGEELLHIQGGPQKVSPNGLLV